LSLLVPSGLFRAQVEGHALTGLLLGIGALAGPGLSEAFPRWLRAPVFQGLLLAAIFAGPAFAGAGSAYGGPLFPSPAPGDPEALPILLILPMAFSVILVKEARALPALAFFAALWLASLPFGGPGPFQACFWVYLCLFQLPDCLRAPKGFLAACLLFAAGLLGLPAQGLPLWLPPLAVILTGPPICLLYVFAGGRPPKRRAAWQPAPGFRAALLCRVCKGGVAELASRPEGLGCWVLNSLSGGGPLACPKACLGLMDCGASCPKGAISKGPDGCPKVDPGLCEGCGECMRCCPRGLMTLVPRASRVLVPCSGLARMKEMDALCKAGCLGCGLCRKACPLGAIGRPGPQAPPPIDHDLCQGYPDCGLKCRDACPRGLPDPSF
jgi:Fe-S-cluster-containing hydrogenase component 2